MQLNMKFKSKFSGRLCAMRHSAELRLFAMPHNAELRLWSARYAAWCGVGIYLGISRRNQNQIRKYFRMIISDLKRIDLLRKKTKGRKSRDTVPLKGKHS
jgi:hypothetical protein